MLKRRPRTPPPRAKSSVAAPSWTTPATTDLFRTIALLREAGYRFEADDRRLFAPCENYPLDLLFVRAEDIPEYTADGVVDLGITGSNLVEERGSPVSQSMALGFGYCRLRVAVPDERPLRQLSDLAGRPVATSHPRTTARFFKERNVAVELIEISGAVEITPPLRVGDAIRYPGSNR